MTTTACIINELGAKYARTPALFDDEKGLLFRGRAHFCGYMISAGGRCSLAARLAVVLVNYEGVLSRRRRAGRSEPGAGDANPARRAGIVARRAKLAHRRAERHLPGVEFQQPADR